MKILSLSIAVLLCTSASIALAEEHVAHEHTDQHSVPTDGDELVEMPLRRYIIGGAVGTLFGFGIGHAVQKRYLADGWLYTLGELSGAVLMGTGFFHTHVCKKEEGLDRASCTDRGEMMAFAGYLMVAGWRVAEIVNVWLPPEDRYLIVDGQARRNKPRVLPVFNTWSYGLALITPL